DRHRPCRRILVLDEVQLGRESGQDVVIDLQMGNGQIECCWLDAAVRRKERGQDSLAVLGGPGRYLLFLRLQASGTGIFETRPDTGRSAYPRQANLRHDAIDEPGGQFDLLEWPRQGRVGEPSATELQTDVMRERSAGRFRHPEFDLDSGLPDQLPECAGQLRTK